MHFLLQSVYFGDERYLSGKITNDENDKGGENFVREVGGEGKNHKGGGRHTPCVPTL